MELRNQFDETFYNDFYKRVSIFLTYYEYLFGNSQIMLSIISDGQVHYKGLDCMNLGSECADVVEYLKVNSYSVENKRYLTTQLFEKFQKHTLTTEDFGPFDIGRFMEAGRSALGGYEKKLIRAVIKNSEDYNCISLPLIGMANFVGAINILWQPQTIGEFDPNLLRRSAEVLTKMFTREYESMLVFRDLDFLDEATNIRLKHQYELLIKKSERHPFLQKLGYPNYYEIFGEQFLRYNKKILHVKQKVDSQDIKTAIISIVVDSFAHNVGAHSLTALKWWIQKRSELLDYKFRFGKNETLTDFNPREIEFEHLREISKNHTKFYQQIGRTDMKNSLTSLMSIIKHAPAELEEKLLTFSDNFRDFKNPEQGQFTPRFPVPIDYGVWLFLEYMRDKSAFWSGVSRDIVYSGESISWYDLLWRDFINNPLFLGTIAHSEGIHKLNVWLEVRDEYGEIQQNGLFAQVDLSVIDKEIAQVERLYQDSSESYESKIAEESEDSEINYSTYGFVRLAKQFSELKTALENLPEVFLPNGIIGKHAFYTVLENTLRNVKHFKNEYGKMQKHGIDFHISIQPHQFQTSEIQPEQTEKEVNWQRLAMRPQSAPVPKMSNQSLTEFEKTKTRTKKKPTDFNLFKVGLWLEHPIPMVYEMQENSEIPELKFVYFNYFKRLSENIVNQYGKPNLGGNSQDKICAAMLLNNTFRSVVETDEEFAKVGYRPYVKIESCIETEEGKYDGIYQSPTNLLESNDLEIEKEKYLRQFPIGSMGFIKKYMYMWKAESLKVVDDHEFDVRTENLSRFRIIAAKNVSLSEAKNKFRLQGVIRIVNHERVAHLPEGSEEKYHLAYLNWLKKWLALETDEKLETLISIRNTPIGLISLDEAGEITYQNYSDLYGKFDSDNFQGRKIELSHGNQQAMASQQLLEIRSHGTFLKHFYDNKPFGKINKYRFTDKGLLIEFFEAINTKVCIIDNRIFTRIPKSRRKTLDRQLNLHFFPEQDASWHESKAQIMENCNFLIFHLSFIESFNRQKYTANEIDAFIRNEIGILDELPDNLIVTITTGRGRSGWLATIEHPKITFRPIESLVDALEDGLSMQDFFQVKYNLVKVLMGS